MCNSTLLLFYVRKYQASSIKDPQYLQDNIDILFYYTFNFVVEEDNESSNQGNGWKINECENNNVFSKKMKRK